MDKVSFGSDSLCVKTDPRTDGCDTPFLLDVDNETEEEIESEDEVEIMALNYFNTNRERTNLSIFSGGDLGDTVGKDTGASTEVELLKALPNHVTDQLTQRRIFREDNGTKEPEEVAKIPIEVSILGETLRGIIDSGSERSYLSKNAYERVKSFQLKNVTPDSISIVGVCLGDNSLVKTEGGTCFMIEIGDVYGPQWFSILAGLSNDLILGMDFWLSFRVVLDPHKRAWTLTDSKYSYPLSYRFVAPTELKALSDDQSQNLKNFLDSEFAKFDIKSSGVTDLIKHVIELNDPIPHRQKPYRRSEAIRNFINEEVDRLLSKGYVTWSNSDWASSPVVVPKANGGLRFCIDYRMLNKKTSLPSPTDGINFVSVASR